MFGFQSFGEMMDIKENDTGATKEACLYCCLCGKYYSLLLAK